MSDDSYRLRFLESAENVKVALRAICGRTPSTSIARGVTVCLQQGRMFFDAASESPLEIRPLLIYYGMTAYAKAVVTGRNLMTLSALPQSHGLKDISEHNARLVALAVKIQGNGLFHALNDTVQGLERIWYFEGSALQSHLTPMAKSDVLNNRTLTLKEVLARTIGLEKLYQETFSEGAKVHLCYPFLRGGPADSVDLRVDTTELITDRASVQRIVGALRAKYPMLRMWRLESAEKAWGHSIFLFKNLSVDGTDEFASDALREDNGGFTSIHQDTVVAGYVDFRTLLTPVAGGYRRNHPFLVEPWEGEYASEISILYAGMYLLSSLVRYRPQIWIHAVSRFSDDRRPADDNALALVEHFMGTAKGTFLAFTAAVLTAP